MNNEEKDSNKDVKKSPENLDNEVSFFNQVTNKIIQNVLSFSSRNDSQYIASTNYQSSEDASAGCSNSPPSSSPIIHRMELKNVFSRSLPFRTQSEEGLSSNNIAVSSPNVGSLPTYSTVMKMGPPRPRSQPSPVTSPPPSRGANRRFLRPIEITASTPFVGRIPPPSYAEVQGGWIDAPARSSEEILFGPDPLYMVCPNCTSIVITETFSQRSTVTHFTAMVLCLFGCWPCCLLPYCMNTCKNTYHHCPICGYFFGMYRPW